MAAEDRWDVDGYFVGTVDGLPVNAIFQFRTHDGKTTVLVHSEHDPDYQSTVSQSPAIEQMAEYITQQLHRARRFPSAAPGPVPTTSAGCRITSLHDYRDRDRADSAAPQAIQAEDRARARSG